MTTKVRQYIEAVRTLFEQERAQLAAEREKNERLREELDEKAKQLRTHTELIGNLENDISQLKFELDENKKRISDLDAQAGSGSERNEQIDELVKEIEYCIAKLKDRA